MSSDPPDTDQRIASYRLLSKIGEGGMGVVHLAANADGRRVALKVLRSHVLGDDEARARLAREVAALGRVRSHRVAEVVDADPWGDTPYVATRYVPGWPLHDHVQTHGPIVGDDLLHLARGLLEALVAVHQVGVLHRDVKPSNVLMEGRSPVLIDFGLARAAEDPKLTGTGWLLGTPGYLAPEILYGDDATVASDVHSWAATLAYAATGRAPFGTGPALAIMDRVRRGEHDLGGVDGDLLPLLRRCLHPEPGQRPTPDVLLRELAAHPPVPPGPRGHDEPTMPVAAVPGTDTRDAGTTVTHGAGPTDRTAVAPAPAPPARQTSGPPTRVLQTTHPTSGRRGPAPAESSADPQPSAPIPASGAPGALARFHGAVVKLGLAGLLLLGFAAAPYVVAVVLAAVVLVLRTWSWSVEAGRLRRDRRGYPRWYDAPVAVLALPWHLVVATAGTVLLAVWAAFWTALAGAGSWYGGLEDPLPVLVAGLVLAVTVWLGPGARRFRGPVRAGVRRVAARRWAGWVAVALVLVAIAILANVVLTAGTLWEPAPGPPWRPGAPLTEITDYL